MWSPQKKVAHYKNLTSGRKDKNGLGMKVTTDPKLWQLELLVNYVLCSWPLALPIPPQLGI